MASVCGRLGIDGTEDDSQASTRPFVGVLPGAARGPSKRWPPDRFASVAARLAEENGCRVLVLGTRAERDLCEGMAHAAGPAAVSLAGETSLRDVACLLSLCRVVLCNDSGGMHLAAAAGTRVVAVFGMTDPETTGPLGSGHALVLAEGVERSRDIARNSGEAVRALQSIPTHRVYEAAARILAES